MTATKCIKTCRHGQEVQLFFRPNVRMGKECDPCDFDHGMIISASKDGSLNSLYSLQRQKTSSKQQFCMQKHVVNEGGQRNTRYTVVSRRASLKTQCVKPLSGLATAPEDQKKSKKYLIKCSVSGYSV